MKKYRLTKITVKTREIISISTPTQDSVCPLCCRSLSALFPPKESSAAAPNTNEQAAELSPPAATADKTTD